MSQHRLIQKEREKTIFKLNDKKIYWNNGGRSRIKEDENKERRSEH